MTRRTARAADPADATDEPASGEMFYVEDGVMRDADLHAELLEGAEKATILGDIRRRMLAEGWPQDAVDRLWPLPERPSAR